MRGERGVAAEAVAEGDSEGVSGVGRVRGLVQAEKGLDHEGDLLLAAAAVRRDELLNLQRLVEEDRQAGLGGSENGRRASLPNGYG